MKAGVAGKSVSVAHDQKDFVLAKETPSFMFVGWPNASAWFERKVVFFLHYDDRMSKGDSGRF